MSLATQYVAGKPRADLHDPPGFRPLPGLKLSGQEVLEIRGDRNSFSALRHGCFRARRDDRNAQLAATFFELCRSLHWVHRQANGVTLADDLVLPPEAESLGGCRMT